MFLKRNLPHAAFISFLLLMLITSLVPAFAAQNRPWYAERLEKLGFYIFEPAFQYQDFKVTTLSGETKSRSSLKGKVILLNFWATWCPPCKQEIPTIEKLHNTMKGQNFEVFAVSVGETPDTVKKFVAQQKMTYPVYLDPQNLLSRTYASQGIPTTYLIDKNGMFIAALIGAYDYANPELVAILSELAKK